MSPLKKYMLVVVGVAIMTSGALVLKGCVSPGLYHTHTRGELSPSLTDVEKTQPAPKPEPSLAKILRKLVSSLREMQ